MGRRRLRVCGMAQVARKVCPGVDLHQQFTEGDARQALGDVLRPRPPHWPAAGRPRAARGRSGCLRSGRDCPCGRVSARPGPWCCPTRLRVLRAGSAPSLGVPVCWTDLRAPAWPLGGRNEIRIGIGIAAIKWLGKEMISLSPPPRRTVRTSHPVHGSSNRRTPRGALLL